MEHARGDHDHKGHQDHPPLKASAHATLHCLIGCFIGEAIGVGLGVWFGLGVVLTIATGVVFAYIFGFALALVPLMRSMNLSLAGAMRVVWLGEAISIAVMEIVMNSVDYWIGGLQATSIGQPVFWIGLAAAAPAGFLAAWPVNHWLLKKEIRAPH
ncbi:MAG: DUF4396 domain-containing protein [Rhodospirillales bacterium]|nr:DUF4396 domain-containing protein [Rhodospirillales bacterium]MBO6786321.1 DUF4396 domain-containing protein [Rhodospirillales bacterium]